MIPKQIQIIRTGLLAAALVALGVTSAVAAMRRTRSSRGWLAALAAVVAFGCLLAAPQGAKATLLGDDFDLNSNVVGGPFDDFNVVVTAGNEFSTGDATNVGGNFLTNGTASFINVGSTSITFFFDFGHQGTYTFTDLDFTDAPFPGTITAVASVLVSGTLPGVTNPTLAFTADSVTVSLDCSGFGSGLHCDAPGGTEFRIDITHTHPAPVDTDGDGIPDNQDNCPTVPNPGQEQTGNNVGGLFGDACVDPSVNIPASASVDPTATIGAGSEIHRNATIGPGAQIGNNTILKQRTVVGEDTVVGDNVVLNKDVVLGDNVIVGDNVHIGKNTIVGDGATIGANSQIGKDNVIGANADVGATCGGPCPDPNVVTGKTVTIGPNAVVPPGTTIPKETTFP